jgi:alpha-L-fucosidase
MGPDALVSHSAERIALANHHDNLDLWDSRTVGPCAVGPQEHHRGQAAQRLALGVSVHAAHAWSYEPRRAPIARAARRRPVTATD